MPSTPARPTGPSLPARDHAEIRVADALLLPGCVLCRARSTAEERLIDSLVGEAVTDVGVRRRLDAARGFCPRHTALLPARERSRRGGSTGSTILLGEMLRGRLSALDELAETRGRRLSGRVAAQRAPAACPICVDVQGAVGGTVAVLLGRLTDPAWADALGRADLCLDDLLLLWATAAGAGGRLLDGWRPIARTQIERLRGTLVAADGFIAHSGHDRQHETTDEERGALDDILAILAPTSTGPAG
jgi:hypothetical protein